MRKPRMLFDASPLEGNIDSKSLYRSGVFWVTYNILKHFHQSQFYEITLRFRKRKENILNLPYIILPDKPDFQRNIKIHKEYIKNSKNMSLMFFGYIKIIKNITSPPFWHLFSIGTSKRINSFDIYFSSMNDIPDILKNHPSIELFHILHDCIPVLDNMPYEKNFFINHPILRIIKNLTKETYYFCVSQCTKDDFLRIAPEKLDETKMFVTLNATSQDFFPIYNKTLLEAVLKKYNVMLKPDDCYIFSLCSIDPRKNLVFTIKCFIQFIKKHSIENMYFLLGGGHFKTYIEQFTQEIAGFADFQDKIRKLGYIDDEDVNILYSNSLFFTFLSQYEGFGMPPLEAMQAGTPVICSNNSSLPEVVGDAAITITYNDEEACIKAFEDFYFNKELREEYIKKGLERAKLFSWEKTFQLMNEKIMSVLQNK